MPKTEKTDHIDTTTAVAAEVWQNIVDTSEDADGNTPKDWAALFCLLDKHIRAALAGEILNLDTTGEKFTERADRFIYDVLLKAIVATENDTETRQTIAGALNITPADLQAIADKRIEELKTAATDAEQGELFPTTTADIVEQTEAELTTGLEILTNAEYGAIARPMSKLARKIRYFLPSNKINLSLQGAGNLTVKWQPPTDQQVTPFDQAVETAVSNLIVHNGACFLSAAQIFRAMNGLDATRKVPPTMIAAIAASRQKLKETYVEFQRLDKDGNGHFIRGKVFDTIEGGTISNGQKTERLFGFLREGLFFRAERDLLNGLQTVEDKHLNFSLPYWRRGDIESGKGEVSATPPKPTTVIDEKTGKPKKILPAGWERATSISFTELTIVIRDYLLLEIHRIKNAPSHKDTNNKILYSTIADYVSPIDTEKKTEAAKKGNAKRYGAQATEQNRGAAERQKALRLRKTVIAILGHFQATGLITRFYETTEGQKKTGVIIEADKTDKAQRAIKRADDLKRITAKKRKKS